MSTITIHPSAVVSEAAKIGDGTRIWHHCQVREGAEIGEDCVIGKGVYIDVDVKIGSRVKIQNDVSIYRGVQIEDGVFVGPHVSFVNDRYPRAINPDGTLQREGDWDLIETWIHKGASLGANATILCGVEIGRWALVGAGSVVTGDVADHALVVGNPARRVGYVCPCGKRLKETGPEEYTCLDCGEIVSIRGKR